MAFNQKNPPWQRNAGQSITGMQALVSFPQAQTVFNQNIGLQQQQNMSLIPQMGLPQQQMYSQTVQYPASRPMNTIAFQNQAQSQSSQVGQNSSKFNPNQRVFSGTGHVTKVQNDFGFIDEEVFFHKNVCKGSFPKSGDRVLVEAAYNQNMPFKWNATRVQVLQSTSNSIGSRQAYNSSQNSADRSARNRYSPSHKSPDRYGHRSSNHETRQRDLDNDDRRRRRDDKEVDRHRDKQRDRTPERRDRDRSPIRKLSPKRRKVRTVTRYMVQMPKQLLTLRNADILELRRRYHTLYIPSDFFTSQIRWVDAFPPNEPFTIRKPCSFHIMHKDVEPLHPYDNATEPIDADYLYSAKVMLMSTPPITEFYQKCFATGEERSDDDRDFLHPTRLISFLVGIRGKNETMAIGGPWSPSLDGENPQCNPNVLIKTAIRTCKGLTGIDLSNCSRWYRFVELYYRRSETYHKGHLIPSRIETVVIFLPDVRSCLPTQPEWDELHLSYKSHLEHIVNIQYSDSPHTANSSSAVGGEIATSTASRIDHGTGEKFASTNNNPAETIYPRDNLAAAAESTDAKPSESAELIETNEDTTTTNVPDNEKDETAAADVDSLGKLDIENSRFPDVKKMKVAELKVELQARNLPTDGVKTVLAARLIKILQEEKVNSTEAADNALDTIHECNTDEKVDENMKVKQIEKNEEEDYETMENVDMSEVTVIDEYDSTKSEEKSNDEVKKHDLHKLNEKERQLLQKRYSLPKQPHIIVHPSRTAKSGKFDCAVMSLSVLLDYRQEDSKEHSFEVSLFAELFNEMLTRDFGFNIYKALHLISLRKNDDSKKEHIADEKESVENKINGSEEKESKKCIDEDLKTKDDKEKERNLNDDHDLRKRSRFDATNDEDRCRKEKEKSKDKVNYYTADRELLLSFVYFDVSHCGYIFDKDIEDLLYTLGLNLSRSQIRRVIAKALTRDVLYYRKLTDVVKETIIATKDDENSTTNETCENISAETLSTLRENEISETMLQELATGNNNFLDQLQENLTALLKSDEDPPCKKIKVEPTQNDGEIPKTNNGLVVHNGAVLDISKLLEQIRRSEKIREDAEIQLVDLRRENINLQKCQSRASDKIKEQVADIKSYTRKLIDAEQNLREITKKSNEYFTTLSSVHDRVSVVINRTEAKRSSSITSSKRGSSKDRSYRKERKSKDDEVPEKIKTDERTLDANIAELSVKTCDLNDSIENITVSKDLTLFSDEQKIVPSSDAQNKS